MQGMNSFRFRKKKQNIEWKTISCFYIASVSSKHLFYQHSRAFIPDYRPIRPTVSDGTTFSFFGVGSHLAVHCFDLDCVISGCNERLKCRPRQKAFWIVFEQRQTLLGNGIRIEYLLWTTTALIARTAFCFLTIKTLILPTL